MKTYQVCRKLSKARASTLFFLLLSLSVPFALVSCAHQDGEEAQGDELAQATDGSENSGLSTSQDNKADAQKQDDVAVDNLSGKSADASGLNLNDEPANATTDSLGGGAAITAASHDGAPAAAGKKLTHHPKRALHQAKHHGSRKAKFAQSQGQSMSGDLASPPSEGDFNGPVADQALPGAAPAMAASAVATAHAQPVSPDTATNNSNSTMEALAPQTTSPVVQSANEIPPSTQPNHHFMPSTGWPAAADDFDFNKLINQNLVAIGAFGVAALLSVALVVARRKKKIAHLTNLDDEDFHVPTVVKSK